ncbi:MAG TPA: hypothetical protein VHB51_00610 [Candidatus Saccharimonadales bacterium]|nr:hypothetical protein [Candidatus Saccharimonadales bacterium]
MAFAGRRPAIRGNSSITYQKNVLSLPIQLNGSSNDLSAVMFAHGVSPTVPIRIRGIILQGFLVWEAGFPNARQQGSLRVSLYDSSRNLLRQTFINTISAGSGAITSPSAYQKVFFADIQLNAAATYYVVFDGLVSRPANCFLYKNDHFGTFATVFTVPFAAVNFPGQPRSSMYVTSTASTDPADFLPGGPLYVFKDPGNTIDFVDAGGAQNSGGFIAAR